MKIMTNTIGNYSPHINNNPVKKVKTPAKDSAEKLKIAANSKSNEMTTEEKDFFINMYPQNKTEINDYHFYHKNGEMGGVKIGSLLDRRG